MKTLKNILFIIVITLLTTSCTDNTEDLVTNQKDTIENTQGRFFTDGKEGNREDNDK